MSNEHCPDQARALQTEAKPGLATNFLRSNSQLTYQLGAIIDYQAVKSKKVKKIKTKR